MSNRGSINCHSLFEPLIALTSWWLQYPLLTLQPCSSSPRPSIAEVITAKVIPASEILITKAVPAAEVLITKAVPTEAIPAQVSLAEVSAVKVAPITKVFSAAEVLLTEAAPRRGPHRQGPRRGLPRC